MEGVAVCDGAELRFSGYGQALVVKTHTRSGLCSAALCWSAVLLQHLASRFGQLCRKETTCGQGAGGKHDGHGLGDADE